MPTLRDHLRAAEDAGKGGGHHGGHHHGGGHRRGRGGGVVFYDRAPEVVIVEEDCPPGFYYDDFGNCRPLPYHSQNVGALSHRRSRRVRQAPTEERAYTVAELEYMAAQKREEETKAAEARARMRRAPSDAASFDLRRPTFDAAGEKKEDRSYDPTIHPIGAYIDSGSDAGAVDAVPVGWFNPFDPYGSGYALNTKIERNKLNDEIIQADARIASAQAQGAKIPQNIVFDYVSFRKDWEAIKDTDLSTDQLNSMRARFRSQLDLLAPYMKVDDLRPPAPLSQTIPSTVGKFSESMQTVAAAGAVTVIAVVAIAAYLVRPHLGTIVKSQTETGASIAKTLAK
jgi:hypothetical protein